MCPTPPALSNYNPSSPSWRSPDSSITRTLKQHARMAAGQENRNKNKKGSKRSRKSGAGPCATLSATTNGGVRKSNRLRNSHRGVSKNNNLLNTTGSNGNNVVNTNIPMPPPASTNGNGTPMMLPPGPLGAVMLSQMQPLGPMYPMNHQMLPMQQQALQLQQRLHHHQHQTLQSAPLPPPPFKSAKRHKRKNARKKPPPGTRARATSLAAGTARRSSSDFSLLGPRAPSPQGVMKVPSKRTERRRRNMNWFAGTERMGAPRNDTSFIMCSLGGTTPGGAPSASTPFQPHLLGARTPGSTAGATPGTVELLTARAPNLEDTELIDAFGSMQGRLVPAAWAAELHTAHADHHHSHTAGQSPDEDGEARSGAERERGEECSTSGASDGEDPHHHRHRGRTPQRTPPPSAADVDTRGLLLVQDGELDAATMGDPAELRARINKQAAHIGALEDDNLNLRERLELLQREVKALRARGGGSGGGDGGVAAEASGECTGGGDYGDNAESALCSGMRANSGC